MRISGIFIDGFGIFHNISLKDLPPGLILFQGDNETGKSTLLAFIRTILFGFLGGRSKENPYPPLVGGQQGGQIVIKKDTGEEFVIERRPGKGGGPVTITYPDGTKKTGETLGQLLGGTTCELFKNIYAFSLNELQTFDTLQSEAVKGVIYGASAGMPMMNLQKAQSRIEQRIGGLFKSGGSNPIINKKLTALEEIRAKLREASTDITKYDEASLELKRTEAKILELQLAATDTATDRNRVDTYMKLWQAWIALQGYEADIKGLSVVVERFPEKGVARLDKEIATLRERQDHTSSLEIQLEELHREAEGLSINEALLNRSEAITSLLGGLSKYNDTVKSIPVNHHKLNALKQEIRCFLDSLGPEWVEEKVKAIDRSLFTRETILRFQEGLTNLKSVRVRAQDKLEASKNEYDTALRNEAVAKKELVRFRDLKGEVDEKTLHALQRGRDQFAFVVAELLQLKEQLDNANEQLDQTIKYIDPDLNRTDLTAFDSSVSAQEKVQSFEFRLIKGEQDCAEATLLYHGAQETLKDLQERHACAVRKLDKISPLAVTSRDELTRRKSSIRELCSLLLQRESLARDNRHNRERLSDKQQEANRITLVSRGGPIGILRWLALGSFLLGLSISGALVFLGRWADGFLVGGVLLAVAVVTFLVHRKIQEGGVLSNGAEQSLLASIEREIDSIGVFLEEMDKHASELDTEISRYTANLKVSDSIKTNDIDVLESEVEEAITIFDGRIRLTDEVEKIQAEIRRVKEAVDSAIKRMEGHKNDLERTNKEWEKVLNHLRLRTGISPRTVSLIFTKVDAAKEQLRVVHSLEERLLRMEETKRRYCALAGSVPSLAQVSEEATAELVSAVDLYFEQVSQEQRRLQDLKLAEQTLTDKQKRKDEASIALQEAESHYNEVVEKEGQALKTWQTWLKERGLNPDLSPTTALEAFQTVENCIRQLNEMEQLTRLVDDQEQGIRGYQDLAIKMFKLLGRQVPEVDRLPVSIDQLGQEFNKSKENRSRREQIEKQVGKVHTQMKSVKAQVKKCEKKIAELFKAGDAKDEETFRTRGRLFEERTQLLANIAQTERNLLNISGETDLKSLKKKLSSLTIEHLKSEHDQFTHRQQEIEEELNSLRQTKAELLHKMDNLASSDDISRLRADEERVLEEIRIAAADWSCHAIATYLLQEAKRRFEQEQQPKVIRDAGAFFKTITGGEYQTILAPIGEDNIEVVTHNMKRKTTEELSRGTAEQLYLAIRFGYISNYSANGEHLPIIMDDILVNFDPKRASQSAKSILELARTHQVLYFSCHPETVTMLRGHDPNTPLYFLDKGGLIAKN